MKVKVVTFLLALISLSATAQYEPLSRPRSGEVESETDDSESTQTTEMPSDVSKRSFTQRLVYGGNLQLAFGSLTVIEVSPRVGYQITNDLVAGLGANYIYYKYGQNYFYNGSPSQDFTIWGGNAFSLYHLPFDLPIAFQGEYEFLNFEVYDPYTFESAKQWVPALRFGGGIANRFGRGGGIYFMALYDVLWDSDYSLNPGSPWSIRASFLF